MQLFGSLVAILDDFVFTDLAIFDYKPLLIGFSVMFAWITLIKYLKYNDNVNILT